MSNETLRVEVIRTDGGTQPRAALDQPTIEDYAQTMRENLWDWERHELPVVFYDGKDYWLASGFHRIGSARLAGLDEIPVDIRQGTQRDAILFSCGTNTDHGLRRTN